MYAVQRVTGSVISTSRLDIIKFVEVEIVEFAARSDLYEC